MLDVWASRAMRLLVGSEATAVEYSSAVAVTPEGTAMLPSALQVLPFQTRYCTVGWFEAELS